MFSQDETVLSYGYVKKNKVRLAEDTHKLEQSKVKKDGFKFIDLFAGIGGVKTAFERSGAECVFSSEIDTFAQYTYFRNHGVVPYGDIQQIPSSDIPEHDILCAGFPCQPFSSIGKREGFKHPTQGTMFHEVLRIIKDKSPKAIFLENVAGLLTHDNGCTIEIIISSLKREGYFCHYTVISAADMDVAQKRRRFYLVAFKYDYSFSFPEPTKGDVHIKDLLEHNPKGYSISKHLQDNYLFKKNDGKPQIVDFNTLGPVNTLVASYYKVQRLTGTFVRDGDTGIRLLSEKECKAIMGFPNDFIMPVSRTQMYKQFGNSVIIPVVHKISENIVKTLTEK
jgi:DNA (cytosine-5)-methyltransferase 1